jgi:hypothetical protein
VIRRAATCAWMVAAIAFASRAQEITPPVLGYLFDNEAQGLRAIMGVPGAARMGELVSAPFPISAAAVAPSQEYAVVVNAVNGAAAVLIPASSRTIAINTALPGVDRVILSPTGSAAALIHTAGHSVSLVAGLPSNGQVTLSFELSPQVSAFALSDDGMALAIAESSTVSILSAFPRKSFTFDEPVTALAFARGGHELGVAATSSVFQISGSKSILLRRSAAGTNLSFLLSSDIGWLTAEPGAGVIQSVSAGGTVQTIDCGCLVSALEYVRGHVLRTVSGTAGPMLLDLGGVPRSLSISPITAARQ